MKSPAATDGKKTIGSCSSLAKFFVFGFNLLVLFPKSTLKFPDVLLNVNIFNISVL
jgi:hypothetical protein